MSTKLPSLISLGKLLIRGLGGLGRRNLSPSVAQKFRKKPTKRPPKRIKKKRTRKIDPPSGNLVVYPPSSLMTSIPPEGFSVQDMIHPQQRLRESIEGFLLDQRSPHTRQAYSKDLKRFIRYLLVRREERGVETLDRAVLIGYKEYMLSEKLEHTTIDRHLATLKSFFKWLVDDGVIEKSPAQGVRFLNPKKLSTTQGFSDEEVKKVLALPNLHTRTGAQHYAILMILFYCGLRRSELCSLKTRSIGRERKHAVIRLQGKGNTERVIVLIPAVWNAIDHYLRMTRKDLALDQPLFSPIRNNRTGVAMKPLDPSMIFYIVRRYARLAGIAHRVSPHSCRATAISNARDHQVPDRAIQEFAGWASPHMITRYDKRKTSIEQSAAHSIRYGGEARPMPLVTDPSSDVRAESPFKLVKPSSL